MRPWIASVVISTAFALLVPGEPGLACGFDGALGANFGAMHPKSLAVAFAVRDATNKGRVSKAAIAPLTRGPTGYWRAASRIMAFQRRMSDAKLSPIEAIGISMLFIESQLWSRLTPSPDGYRSNLHTQGPMPDDAVIITNETVLASVLDGTLKFQEALDLGVIVIDGDQRTTETIKNAITAALERPPTAAITNTPPQVSLSDRSKD